MVSPKCPCRGLSRVPLLWYHLSIIPAGAIIRQSLAWWGFSIPGVGSMQFMDIPRSTVRAQTTASNVIGTQQERTTSTPKFDDSPLPSRGGAVLPSLQSRRIHSIQTVSLVQGVVFELFQLQSPRRFLGRSIRFEPFHLQSFNPFSFRTLVAAEPGRCCQPWTRWMY